MSADLAITGAGLGKRFGDLWALRHVDLAVPTGSVLGLLGPNGAGKTTAIRILTTLLRPDEGHATVAGHDVVRQPDAVRRRIGLAGQQASVDELLTGRDNLEMVGRLYHLGRPTARVRAAQLLERFDLMDAADRLAKTYSGGMRRRLDLACALVAEPPVLFLDEPTTGLDPHSRNELWSILQGLVRDGTTVLLTTQYLEEADHLADRIMVVDHGTAVAEGTPAELKATVGGSRLDVTLIDAADLASAQAVLGAFAQGSVAVDAGALHLSTTAEPGTKVAAIVRALDGAGIDSDDVSLRPPTLDDVFLELTGHRAEESPASDEESAA